MDEATVQIEAIRLTDVRGNHGVLKPLADDILTEGLRHPVTLWTDGTLISGGRRVRAHLSRPGMPQTIRSVFVDTIEDAAKRMLIDNEDDRLSARMKPTEICRLWEVLRKLDEPAAARRADEARRRGVELRRAALAGKRKPGRSQTRGEEYTLRVLAEPFGMSESTASRLWTMWQMSKSTAIDPRRRSQAAAALKTLDEGQSTIWGCYTAIIHGKSAPKAAKKPPAAVPSAPAAKQVTAWERALPQLEGLTAGLVELGPTSPDLAWEQIGPVCARLSAVRRDLEKIIRQMKESNQV
jgi:hypothetical protein